MFETTSLAAKSINWETVKFCNAIQANKIVDGHIWEQLENSEYGRIKKLIDEKASNK